MVVAGSHSGTGYHTGSHESVVIPANHNAFRFDFRPEKSPDREAVDGKEGRPWLRSN